MFRLTTLFGLVAIFVADVAYGTRADSESVTVSVSQKDSRIYIVILNPSEKPIRVGPMVYSSTMSDISIGSSTAEQLRLRDPAQKLPGKDEMQSWNLGRILKPKEFREVVVPKEFFARRYIETGCHKLAFAYRYNYLSGSTRSGAPVKALICW